MSNLKDKRLFLLDMDKNYKKIYALGTTSFKEQLSEKKPEFIYENIRKIYEDIR